MRISLTTSRQRWSWCLSLILVLLTFPECSLAFAPQCVGVHRVTAASSIHDNASRLSATPPPQEPPKRQARRHLQKRRRKNRVGASVPAGSSSSTRADPLGDDFPWDTAETRPLVLSSAREAGEDYWIDPEDLRRATERAGRIRAPDPGQIPKEKLWTEVLSPYKQNWIGLISVSIIALAFIFKNFPEVIDPPMISNIPLNL